MKKYFNKQTIIAFMFGAFLFTTISLYAVEGLNISVNPYPIIKNGEEVKASGYNINGFTYLKTRDVANLVGTNIEFKDSKIYIGVIEDNSKPVLTPIDYKGCKAIKYNDNIYVKDSDIINILKIKLEYKNKVYTFINTNIKVNISSETTQTNDYVICSGDNHGTYLNIKLFE